MRGRRAWNLAGVVLAAVLAAARRRPRPRTSGRSTTWPSC